MWNLGTSRWHVHFLQSILPLSLVCNAMMLHLHQTRHRSSHDYMKIRLFHRLELIWLPLRCTPRLNYDWSIHHHRGVAHHCLLQLIPTTRQVQYSFFFPVIGTISPKTPVSLNEWVFQSLNFTFRPLSPFQCCNNVTVSTERISTLKRRRGEFVYRKKRCVLPLWKDADRKRVCFAQTCQHFCPWLYLGLGVLYWHASQEESCFVDDLAYFISLRLRVFVFCGNLRSREVGRSR